MRETKLMVLVTLLVSALFATVVSAHPKKRTPQVSSVEVKDQNGQTATVPLLNWHNLQLGLVGPTTDVWSDNDINERGWWKKVEIVYHLTAASSSFEFMCKQQNKGYIQDTHDNSYLNWPDWSQDGAYPYAASTDSVDDQNRLFLQDTPGIGTGGTVGTGRFDRMVFDMHFRDKTKWMSPSGPKDVFKNGDSDPYFGYWARYVAVFTNPAAPPNGTNNQWTIGGNGNY